MTEEEETKSQNDEHTLSAIQQQKLKQMINKIKM